MGLADMLMGAYGGGAAGQLAQRFGISPEQAEAAVAALAPALSSGLQQNANAQGGLDTLLGALAGGRHHTYVTDPSALDHPDTVADGNAILGHILGSKDVSRQVAGQASTQTGLGVDLLKKMLPVVAAMTMGALSSHASGTNLQQQPQTGGGLMDVLGSLMGGGAPGGGSGIGGLMDILGKLTR
jgi:hypothetical protein